jgi:C4-dicarboxylate-specific signal transduction histidine kinase
LLNIFKNGAEAMADSKQDEPAKFDLQLFAEKDYIVLHIIDNGPGIPHEVLAHIFDPFFTTKKPGIGTGLGLSVSYFIITENHNGSIDAERVNPHGTKFTIKLPRD